MLLLLQQRGRLTAEQLAAELEVSVRTIYRDLEALSASGVPVYSEPGRNGGSQLVQGYRTRLTGLTTKEAEALFASGISGPIGELGLGTVLGAAQLKLLAALPKELAERAALAQQRFHFDAPGWFRGERNDPHLAALSSAVWEDRCVAIEYRHPGSSKPAPRRLEPLGLVCKGGVWYLVATRDGEMRTYRVSRIQTLTVLDEQFDRPPDFDLERYWDATVATVETLPPPVDVVVRASSAGLDALRPMTHHFGVVLVAHETADDSGWHECRLVFENLDDAFIDLIRLAADVEVLTPAALRATVAGAARAMTALYSASTRSSTSSRRRVR